MQRIIVLLLLFLSINVFATRAETDWSKKKMICYFPNVCDKIVSTVYLTTDIKVHYVEIDCITKKGEYVKYTNTFEVKAPYFGIDKFIMPDKIIFKRWNRDKLYCVEK